MVLLQVTLQSSNKLVGRMSCLGAVTVSAMDPPSVNHQITTENSSSEFS